MSTKGFGKLMTILAGADLQAIEINTKIALGAIFPNKCVKNISSC
ncbi:hypothetical protein AVDCRST_MAG92-4790 [uncultured Coleofasciculus sp.]|uniref:Uncharacterized protein n=1 Tax=uncultured Coleofasciculus sp. TaxID=1267456 RepID=A0A6J4K6V7_9CYAN|nr:hypothetical protein AVDCRST_MAG92-4790 [uncultured Coleofasciculus sp.]